MNQCPCGTGKNYSNCCGDIIEGVRPAATPEELMRSRYTAYTQANIPYIIQSMKSPAADDYDAVTAKAWAQHVQWQKLEVIQASQHDLTGQVEFIVHFSDDDQKQTLHEVSEFQNIDGIWFYVDGQMTQE